MPRSRRGKAAARWALQDAKNKLSEVVNAAVRGEPQIVTRRGVDTAVIISHDAYQELSRARLSPLRSLADWLLAIPKAEESEFDRIELEPRDLAE